MLQGLFDMLIDASLEFRVMLQAGRLRAQHLLGLLFHCIVCSAAAQAVQLKGHRWSRWSTPII